MHDTIYVLIDEMHQMIDDFIAKCDVAVPADIGLDPRSACRLYLTRDAIACMGSDRYSLEYYGGFEYIDRDQVMDLGEYVVYLRTDDNRVDGILERYYGGSN